MNNEASKFDINIYLASKSPRRREILSKAGVTYNIAEVLKEEDPVTGSSESPGKLAESQALSKLRNVSQSILNVPDNLVLAYDTIVYVKGTVLGKPKDRQEAHDMLRLLSGGSHSVFTGFAFSKGGRTVSGAEETKVFFRHLSDDEIYAYIDEMKPYDKAGSYGIQERAMFFIRKIDGDFFNVMGLPLFRTALEIKKYYGIDLK